MSGTNVSLWISACPLLTKLQGEVNNTNDPEAKRTGHLWCYSNDAIKEVESWLEGLSVGMNRNFQSFGSFEKLYDYVKEHIIEKKDVDGV